MIFLTGAAGKTGKAILRAINKTNTPVKALVRSDVQAEDVRKLANVDQVIIGDMRNLDDWQSQLDSVDVLYYICPNIAPDELEIGHSLINMAKKKGISRFVYHSVLHPQIESMPHHWQKMKMEATLFSSGLDYTILQPCAYMQNILSNWNDIKNGKYITPYKITSPISMVDLEDVAETAVKVMTQSGYDHAIFELAGPESLTQIEVAKRLSQALQITVKAEEQSRIEWKERALARGMQESQVLILLKMFEYYDDYGLVGNPAVLKHLLGRPPASFNKFLERILNSGEAH